MGKSSVLLVVALLFSAPAMAETVTVIRPGILCGSADALAKLTRHDGSSLSEGPVAPEQAKLTARLGDCKPLILGKTMVAISIRKNTTVIKADLGDGAGLRSFYLPNVDVRVDSNDTRTATTAGLDGLPSRRVSYLGNPVASPLSKAGVPAPREAGKLSLRLAGISLGDDLQVAKASLAADHAFQKPVETPPDAALTFLLAVSPDGSDVVSVTALSGKVVFIQHKLHFSEGSQPEAAAVFQRLFATYGSSADGDGVAGTQLTKTWFEPPAGSDRAVWQCEIFPAVSDGVDTSKLNRKFPGNYSDLVAFMTSPPQNRNCHKFISAGSIPSDSNGLLVGSVVVYMYNADPLRARQEALEAARTDQERRRVEKANSSIKPF